MKRFLAVCILSISCMVAYGQQVTKTVSKTKSSNDGTMGLDTNKLAVDEQGNKLQFYQYRKLILSGQYNITMQGVNGFPATEYRLVKRSEDENLKVYEMVKSQIAIKSAMLQEGSKLNIEPLLIGIKSEEFDNKAIVLIFFTANCEQCNAGLTGLDSFLKQVYDPQKMILVAINNYGADETYDQLKLTPIPNARLIFSGTKIKESYWIPTSNAFVVTNRNHIIQFATGASGGIVGSIFKSKITAVLNQ